MNLTKKVLQVLKRLYEIAKIGLHWYFKYVKNHKDALKMTLTSMTHAYFIEMNIMSWLG